MTLETAKTLSQGDRVVSQRTGKAYTVLTTEISADEKRVNVVCCVADVPHNVVSFNHKHLSIEY